MTRWTTGALGALRRIDTCGLCGRALGHGEPAYPVSFGDGGELDVCVECALYLSREGVGAWAALGEHAARRRQPAPQWGLEGRQD